MGERKFSTSVQLTEAQFGQLETIVAAERLKSNSEVIRRSFDFYVKEKYPELSK